MPTPTRILLLEDSPTDAELIQHELGKLGVPVETRWVVTPAEYALALQEFSPELILSDHSVPSFSGRAALELARELTPGVPLILVTASLTEELAVDYMKAGAADYILKDRLLRLAPAVASALERTRSIRESEERYRSLFLGVPVGLFRTSVDGKVLDANPAMAALLGCKSPTDLTATAAWHWYVDPADLERWRDLLSRQESVSGHEVRLRRRDGRQIWVRESAHTVRAPSGAILYHEGIIEDITEEKESKEALRQHHALLNAVIEGTSNPIFVKDLEGRYLLANSAVAEMVGLTVKEMLGKRPGEFLLPEVAREADERHRQVLDSGQPQTFEREVTIKGEGRIFLYDKGIFRDAEGKVAGVFAISRDITEWKRTEEDLRQREALFSSLASASPLGIFSTDAAGRCTYVNPKQSEISGLSTEQSLGLRWIEAIHPEDREAVSAEWTACLQDGRALETEYRMRRPDGVRTVRVQAAPVVRSDGARLGYVGTTEDITQRKSLEEQLRQSQKMEGVGQLAGGVAHDFNNLLTAIMGFSDLLLSDLPITDPHREDVLEIMSLAERAAILTRQLLVFSRQQVLQPQVLDLNRVIAGVHKILARLVREDVEIVTTFAPDLGAVHADPGQLEQIIVNLAVNAGDAMPEGGSLTIETANAELNPSHANSLESLAPGPYVLLRVTDTGVGMDAEIRRHIFEPFFTTKEVGKGTGLGLATVYGIVKQSNGHIVVESEPGRGTTFRIYLPRVEAGTRLGTLETPGTADILGGHETILLVDDEESILKVSLEVLQRYGYTVLTATNGQEALQVCKHNGDSLDLLLTDVVMPRLAGQDLAKQVKSRHPRCRILFMSGYAPDAAVRRGILEVGTAFLLKPFTPTGLASKVREVLDAPLPSEPWR